MFRLKNSLSVFDHLSLRTGSVLCPLALLLSALVFCDVLTNAQTGGKTTPNWRLESPLSGSPPARYDFAMSTCQGGNVLIFGGATVDFFGGAYLNDSWLWDGVRWTDLSNSPSMSLGDRPAARGFASMAFDTAHNQVVLFGGVGYTFPYTLNDTWIFERGFWTKKNPSTSPPARSGASMAYDQNLRRVILFGGQGTAYLGDTWEWDGSSWAQWPPPPLPSPLGTPPPPYSPSGRVGAAMAFYPSGGTFNTGYDLLFGGFGVSGDLRDTNFFGNLGWNNANLIGNPPSRSDASMAAYPVSSTIILFGGSFDLLTYSYNGMWNSFSTLIHPPASIGARMAYHPNSGRLVFFGGRSNNKPIHDSNETWTWGKQVACLPGDGSTVHVGSTVRCFFAEDTDVQFGYWTTDSFSPRFSVKNNKTFHTNGPGPASITAIWFDNAGLQSETFHFTIEHRHKDRDDDRKADDPG